MRSSADATRGLPAVWIRPAKEPGMPGIPTTPLATPLAPDLATSAAISELDGEGVTQSSPGVTQSSIRSAFLSRRKACRSDHAIDCATDCIGIPVAKLRVASEWLALPSVVV